MTDKNAESETQVQAYTRQRFWGDLARFTSLMAANPDHLPEAADQVLRILGHEKETCGTKLVALRLGLFWAEPNRWPIGDALDAVLEDKGALQAFAEAVPPAWTHGHVPIIWNAVGRFPQLLRAMRLLALTATQGYFKHSESTTRLEVLDIMATALDDIDSYATRLEAPDHA